MGKPTYTIARRRFVGLSLGAAVVSGTALSARRALAADQVEVAGIFSGSVTQGNWDPPGYAALAKMAKKYGFKSSYVENTADEAAAAVMRQLAARGVQLIICHSSGFSAAIEDVAPQFPQTQFVLYSYASTTGGLKNYTAWSVNWDQYGFIAGATAAYASKTKHIGIVSGGEIPSEKRSQQFFIKGAQYAAPGITVDAVYTGSFTDIAKAKEIATGLIARGADVLIPSADLADVGTQQAAGENGALTLGSYIDQSKDYPDAVITSTVLNFDASYDQMGALMVAGKLDGTIYEEDLSNNGWGVVTPFLHTDPAVQAKVLDLMGKIGKNQLNIE